MSFTNLSLICSRDHIDEISLLFTELGALAITYFDAENNPIFEPKPGEIVYWEQAKIVGLFETKSKTNIPIIKHKISNFLAQQHINTTIHEEEVPDQDWDLSWKQSIKPLQFGKNLWIYPTWEAPSSINNPDMVNIILDPGMAFGTGSHETTALCLEWIEHANLNDLTIIDYGCGSGILGIACSKFGAKFIYAVDYDSQALVSTKENAQKNAITDNKLLTLTPEQLPSTKVDVIIANILSGPIIELAEKFVSLLKPNGTLVLSGILAPQAFDVTEAFKHKVKFGPVVQKGDWIRLDGIIVQEES